MDIQYNLNLFLWTNYTKAIISTSLPQWILGRFLQCLMATTIGQYLHNVGIRLASLVFGLRTSHRHCTQNCSSILQKQIALNALLTFSYETIRVGRVDEIKYTAFPLPSSSPQVEPPLSIFRSSHILNNYHVVSQSLLGPYLPITLPQKHEVPDRSPINVYPTARLSINTITVKPEHFVSHCAADKGETVYDTGNSSKSGS
jgi:hypothetical protein